MILNSGDFSSLDAYNIYLGTIENIQTNNDFLNNINFAVQKMSLRNDIDSLIRTILFTGASNVFLDVAVRAFFVANENNGYQIITTNYYNDATTFYCTLIYRVN